MMDMPIWDRVALCSVLSVALPQCFGGLVIRSRAGPVRQNWLEEFKKLNTDDKPTVIVPAAIAPDRLKASLSLARSISEGKTVYQSGLLEDAAGGCLIVNMAERLDRQVAALIAAAMDASSGLADDAFCTVLLDESDDGEDGVAGLLAEQLAFHINLEAVSIRDVSPFLYDEAALEALRSGMPSVAINDELAELIVKTCISVGIISMRVPIFCMYASKALAALEGVAEVSGEHVALACQLVLAGRNLVQMSQAQEPQPQPEPEAQPQQAPETDAGDDSDTSSNEDEGDDSETLSAEQLLDEIVAAVASAAVQMDVPEIKSVDRRVGGVSGRYGELGFAYDRGRPDRLVRYQSGRGRVDVLATLRGAAPMQRVRGRTSPDQRLQLRMEDLRTKRFKRRKQCSVIFVVDASGSSAMHRMAEAKGAVESLLSQCYARRDLVSLVAFSGGKSDVVLQPTRSLVRAQREITDLSGGGATPLAHAVATAAELAHLERSRGRTPFLVFMSDGRGNISLQGEPDRALCAEQVRAIARRHIYGIVPSLYFDISRRPDSRSKALSDDLGAQYEFLPVANAGRVSELVRERIGSQ